MERKSGSSAVYGYVVQFSVSFGCFVKLVNCNVLVFDGKTWAISQVQSPARTLLSVGSEEHKLLAFGSLTLQLNFLVRAPVLGSRVCL
jgi:hypothetical protein